MGAVLLVVGRPGPGVGHVLVVAIADAKFDGREEVLRLDVLQPLRSFQLGPLKCDQLVLSTDCSGHNLNGRDQAFQQNVLQFFNASA